MARQLDSDKASPAGRRTAVAAWAVALMLPLLGLGVLLARSKLDPGWTNHRLHFVLFLSVAVVDFALAYSTGQAAARRGDARVLLISLAFFATGGFLGLHGIGTPTILFSNDLAGFKVAVPVGLLVASVFAAASAFVDVRPDFAAWAVKNQRLLRWFVVAAMAVWFGYTVAQLPPLDRSSSEGGTGSLLAIMAAGGTAVYAVAAARYYVIYRHERALLPASLAACFILLAESMVGVTFTGERAWHASWWEWHALVVLGFALVGYAAQREWREERFRRLYLETTRQRSLEVSVLFSDLAGYTAFTERVPPQEMASMVKTYFELAAPLIARHGGDIEHFSGDGMLATFNTRGDQPDHALRAAHAALELQDGMAALAHAHPEWPRSRVGVNTGAAIVRELGGHGHVTYSVVGDSVNVGARLQAHAPVGGVLIGSETYHRLGGTAVAEPIVGLRVKGRDAVIDAFILRALDPSRRR